MSIQGVNALRVKDLAAIQGGRNPVDDDRLTGPGQDDHHVSIVRVAATRPACC